MVTGATKLAPHETLFKNVRYIIKPPVCSSVLLRIIMKIGSSYYYVVTRSRPHCAYSLISLLASVSF